MLPPQRVAVRGALPFSTPCAGKDCLTEANGRDWLTGLLHPLNHLRGGERSFAVEDVLVRVLAREDHRGVFGKVHRRTVEEFVDGHRRAGQIWVRLGTTAIGRSRDDYDAF